MAYIENASADLGCVSIKVLKRVQMLHFDNMDTKRAEVLFIDVENRSYL
jgi:hypothetical protein